jgi:hypothetical protein
VGTPAVNPALICFVDGKSTRSRTGILVHLTAPTIHAGWSGKITLEIANVGPFHSAGQEYAGKWRPSEVQHADQQVTKP